MIEMGAQHVLAVSVLRSLLMIVIVDEALEWTSLGSRDIGDVRPQQIAFLEVVEPPGDPRVVLDALLMDSNGVEQLVVVHLGRLIGTGVGIQRIQEALALLVLLKRVPGTVDPGLSLWPLACRSSQHPAPIL